MELKNIELVGLFRYCKYFRKFMMCTCNEHQEETVHHKIISIQNDVMKACKVNI